MPETNVPNWAAFARRHKAGWSRGHGPGETPPFLLLEAGGRPLALVFLLCDDRDHEAMVIASAVYGTAPDAVVLVHDVLMASRHPDWGDELAPGDLEKIAERGGRDRGEVVDAMAALRCDRSGHVEGRFMPYRMEGREVAWLDPDPDLDPAIVGAMAGFYPEVLSLIMKQRKTAFADAVADPRTPAHLDGPEGLLRCRHVALAFLEHKGQLVVPLDPALIREEEDQP